MDHTDIASQTHRYITDNFLYARPDFRLGNDDRLLEKGVIDSMGVMELVAFLQERFAIVVAEEEIVEEHFGSITAIAAYVVVKRDGTRRG